jgi:L-cystine uptake protein TcyP (sodium:dicarboxylate symporter family)
MNLPKGNKISLFIGVAIGALYGLFCQFVLSRDELKDWFTVMTMGFVFYSSNCSWSDYFVFCEY